MERFDKLRNAEAIVVLNQIVAYLNVNAAIYDIKQDFINELTAERDALQDDLNAATAARAASKQATGKLTNRRKSTNAKHSLLREKLEANPNLTAADYLALQFADPFTSLTPAVLTAPTDLSVAPKNSVNELKFNRNGNSESAIFNIEAKIANAANFVLVGVTKTQNYKHTGRTPGEKVVYRIRAQRGDDFSEYSDTSGVYE